jgi:hypothetical protein
MQMIQDGQYANAPDKPLRMTGTAEACRVRLITAIVLYRAHDHLSALLPQPPHDTLFLFLVHGIIKHAYSCN